MPAPTVNSGETTYTSPSSLTSHSIPVPSHSEGDAIYVLFLIDGVQTLTPDSGFEAVEGNVAIAEGDHTATFGLYRKIAGASEPTNYIFANSAAERGCAIAWSVSGEEALDGSNTSSGDSSTASCPNVTTTEPDALILRAVGTDLETLPHGTIPGYTKIAEVERSSGGTLSAQHTTQASAGPTGAVNVSIAGTQEWGTITAASLPANDVGGFNPGWANQSNKLIGAF